MVLQLAINLNLQIVVVVLLLVVVLMEKNLLKLTMKIPDSRLCLMVKPEFGIDTTASEYRETDTIKA